MKISRQVGTQSQILNVYVQDYSVTTGAGLANIPATTVSYTWFRNNHAGASTGMGVSTASMGTYTSGAWTQINSATALGWYQFCIPNDALLSGDTAALLLRVSTGAFSMAPLPIEIELTKENNQAYMSSQTIGFVLNGVNVTSFSSAITTNANVLQAYGSAIATSASGQFLVSTQAFPTTTNANLLQIYGSAAVTSASGQLRVSTQTIDKTGYAVTAISSDVYVSLNWANVTNKAAYNDLSSTFISTNQSIAGASAPTAAQVAQAVWGEINSSYSGVSTFGYLSKQITSVAAAAAAGVRVTSFASSTLTLDAVDPGAWPLWGVLDAGVIGNISNTSFTGSTAVLRSVSSSYSDDVLQGASLFIYNVTTGTGQRRLVVDNASTNAVVQVDQWLITPTQTSARYVLFATPPASSSNVPGVNLLQIYGSAAATSGAGILTVSTQTIGSFTVAGVNVTSVNGSAIVTTGAGVILVSTQALATTTNANLLQIYGSAAVTSASGQLRVSTQAIDKGGYGVTTNADKANYSVTSIAAYGTALVTSAAGILTVSTQALSGFSGSVNVTSINGAAAVTTGAGVLLVSTQAIPTFAVAGDAMALTAGERAAVAGVILTTTQAESYRSVNAPGSIMQMQYEILANLTEQTASGTTRTLASVTSHTGNVAQYQYDSSSNPASITRIS